MSKKQIKKTYEFLGEGIARKVYALNQDMVLKVSKGEDGYYQNAVENYIFTKASPLTKSILSPILYYSPEHLIMKRAIPLTQFRKDPHVDISEFKGLEWINKSLNELINTFHLYKNDLYHTDSWGVAGNKILLIDYGCTSKFGDFYYEMLFRMKNINVYPEKKRG